MPSYLDTVIANGVDALWRLDALVDGHPTLVDASGNGYHATCFDHASHTHGIGSPIETDAASNAMGGKGGFVTDPTNRRNSFAWQGWIYNEDTSSPQTLISRSEHWSSSNANILGIGGDGDNAIGRLRIDGAQQEVSAPILLGFWYYLVLIYNAGVMQLWVNGALGDQVTGLVGDIDVGASTQFYLGTQQGANQNVWFGLRYDEIAIGIALSQAQIIENHESALNQLLLNGYSNVIPSAILYSDIEPDPVSFPFRHNFSDSLIERISFSTNISTARKGSEQGNGVRPKPRREIEISQVLRDDAERRKLRAKLWANQNRKWFIPILEDREQLTASLSASATTIPVSAQYKDYEINSWVELRQLNDAGQVVKSENALISALSPLTITPTVNTYDAYLSTVGPARRGYVDASISVRGHTDSVEELIVTARLVPEDESVTPNRITAWTPLTTYKGYEVHDPAVWQSNDWTETREYDIDRDVQDVDFDTGTFSPQSDTPGAAEATSYRMLLEGRDKIAALLGWFYYRAGSLIYVWVPTMQKDFAIVSVLGNTLTVSGHEYSENYAGTEARRDLAFVYFDNTMILRRIGSVALAGTDETLTLDTAVPTQTNLRSVSFLRFCRLDGDSLEIARVTDNKARFAWRFRELLSSPT